MVVTGQGKRSAVFAGAGQVGVAQDIPAAVDARTLAVPDADDAVDIGIRHQLMDLAAHDGGRGEILIHAWNEVDIVLVEEALSALQGDVVAAQRRTFVAGNEGTRSQAGSLVAAHLFDGEPHERLNAVDVDDTFFQCIFVVEGERSRHGWVDCSLLYKKRGSEKRWSCPRQDDSGWRDGSNALRNQGAPFPISALSFRFQSDFERSNGIIAPDALTLSLGKPVFIRRVCKRRIRIVAKA